MKKITSLLSLFALFLTPLSPLLAQTNEPTSFWESLTRSINLKNTQTEESVFGSFEVGEKDLGLHFGVDYQVDFKSRNQNLDLTSSLTDVTAKLNITNKLEGENDGLEFKTLSMQANGELRALKGDDLYLKLDQLTVNTDGAEATFTQEMDQFKMMVNLIKGNWYHINLKEATPALMASGLKEEALMQALKKDAKEGVKMLAKEMVTEQVKMQQYYGALWGDENDETLTATEDLDYQTVLTPEVKQNPVDLQALVEKGALTCDDDTYKQANLENGFQYPGCWPNAMYEGALSESEDALIEGLYGYEGEWIYEAGKWYYVKTSSPVEDSDWVSQEDFDYDEAAIETEVTRIMKAVDKLLNQDLFLHHDIISGPTQGYQFYSLKRGLTLEALKGFMTAVQGEPLSSFDQEALSEMINKISLAGVYNIRPNDGIIDNAFARFRFHDENYLKQFELNYSFKLTDSSTPNTIEAPATSTEIDALAKMMMEM